MGEIGALEICGVSLKRELLVSLRLKAKRCRAWFKLKRDERRFMDLVITVVDKVRSSFLGRILLPIIRRLLDAMGNRTNVIEIVMGKVAYWMMVKGRSLAQKLSWIAQGWGNESAATWPGDPGFVRYLTIMCLNKLPGRL